MTSNQGNPVANRVALIVKAVGALALCVWVLMTLNSLGHFFISREVILVDPDRGIAFNCLAVVNVDRVYVGGSRSLRQAWKTFFLGPFKPRSYMTYTIDEVLFEMNLEMARLQAKEDWARRRELGLFYTTVSLNWNEYGVEINPFENILYNRDVPSTGSGGWIGRLGIPGDVPPGPFDAIAEITGLDPSFIGKYARSCQAIVHYEWFFHGERRPETYIVVNDGYLIEYLPDPQ